jgi:hypothetical protein
MEREEREAQSAKLQELIRRGTPADLQEANRLMKVMAGYDTRNKTDYRAKAAEEVIKVQHKAKILEEMLQNHKAGEKIGDGDVFEVSPPYVDSEKITHSTRNLYLPWPVPILRSRKCVRRNLRTPMLCLSSSRSTIAYTAPLKDTVS